MALKTLLDTIVTKDVKFTPYTVLPTTNLTDGQLGMTEGVLYTYDMTRGSWLSVQRQTLIFGRSGTTSDQYLNFAGGGISNKSGYRMMRNACIVGISVQTSNSNNYIIHIRKNDLPDNILSLVVSGEGNEDTTANTNILTTDHLQCYLEYTGAEYGVDDPMVYLEFAWRK